LRQGYPTHGDTAKKYLSAHRFFKLEYPITDHEAAWESILGDYFSAMRELLTILSTAWGKVIDRYNITIASNKD
jgi:hypothetical protein